MGNEIEVLRPIVGIENRTAQEVFDIMCDRFRHRIESARNAREEALDEAAQLCSRLEEDREPDAGWSFADEIMRLKTKEQEHVR